MNHIHSSGPKPGTSAAGAASPAECTEVVEPRQPVKGASQKADESAPPPLVRAELQKTFVAMLFAFVAATVAQQLGEILVVATKAWKLANSAPDMLIAARGDGWLLVVASMHAMLALTMVTVSWFSWSLSQAAMHKSDVVTVFSRKFLIFLIEIFLVTLYFSLSKSAETDYTSYLKDGLTASFVKNPSARPEALQLLWVFMVFATWDYFVDVLRPFKWSGLRFHTPLNHLRRIVAFCGVSLFCASVAYVIGWATPASGGQPSQVIFGDMALILAVFLFIAAKPFEYFLARGMKKEMIGDVTLRERPTSLEKRRFWILLTLVLVCTFLTRNAPCLLG